MLFGSGLKSRKAVRAHGVHSLLALSRSSKLSSLEMNGLLVHHIFRSVLCTFLNDIQFTSARIY